MFEKEKKNATVWAILIVALSSLPYIWASYITPVGYKFLGLTHNIDDGAVYLSWMKQAADGHFFISNLFTNLPQIGGQFNLLFFIMGMFSKVSYLPLITVFHLFRVILGVVFLFTAWQFASLFLTKPADRKIFIPLLGLSSGLGWLFGSHPPIGAVDMWQPEAISFLSIYLNPLFLAGLILMLLSFKYLIIGHRTGEMKYSVYAGLMLLLLGNIHTYDVITVGGVWFFYLIAYTFVGKRLPLTGIKQGLITALICIPSVAYQFYLFTNDPVFKMRVNSPTPSPALISYILGFGLLIIGALIGIYFAFRSKEKIVDNKKVVSDSIRYLLPISWAVIGFVLPYIAVGQQRKLIMGIHIPICILCVYGLSMLLAKLQRRLAVELMLLFLVLTIQSNMSFLSGDINLLKEYKTATHYAPYINNDELVAMDYISKNVSEKDSIFASPQFSLFTPAYTGRRVYYGHWSETPDYAAKMGLFSRFINKDIDQVDRLNILNETKADYYVSTSKETLPPPDFIKAYLLEVFSKGSVKIYRVQEKLPSRT